jgi:hypothetical protein
MEPAPLSMQIAVVVFVVLAIAVMKRFLQIFPFLLDSMFRARGSSALEGSVRVSHDRNLIALVLLIPAVLAAFRYRLWDPSFLARFSPDARLGLLAGAIVAFLLLRFLMHLWLKPRRHADTWWLGYRTGYTWFILLMLVMLPTVGILDLAHVNPLTVKWFILVELGLVYALFLIRKAQILALSCNPLLTFLYLCGLEILPASMLVVSAMLL